MRIGIDLGGTKIEGMALAPDGAPRARHRISTPKDDYPATVTAIVSVVSHLEKETGEQGTVGVGTPGAVSPATGLMKNANSIWLNGRPLATDLAEALNRPVRLANDANCFALSEATDGAGRDHAVVFGVIVGTGTGGGIVVDRRVLVGPNAVACEWVHNPIPWPRDGEWPGPECYCGRSGCIETFLSGPGLVQDHVAHGGDALEPTEIAAGADAGDEGCRASLDRYVDRMARALAGIINILDPDAIVLGGGMSNLLHLYDEVPKQWGPHVFSDRIDTVLVPPAHGDSSGVRGAAWLW